MLAPNFKPAPGSGKRERYTRKLSARAEQARADRAAKHAERKAALKRRHDVFVRDGGRCRALGVQVFLVAADPRVVGHVHHIKFKSAGGTDDLENLILLSPAAHDLVHQHLLDIERMPNGMVSFTRYRFTDAGREVVRQWEG
jgi:hypothetical protein